MRERVLTLAGFIILLAAMRTLAAGQSPETEVREPAYSFGQTLEGAVVSHDFVIRNRGDAPLSIRRVKSDCGCTAVSFTREIPPGGEGQITVRFNSEGYGDRLIRHRVRVETNDPLRPGFDLSIAGEVRAFAKIQPGREVTLSGKAGTRVSMTVTITPVHEFTVRRVRVQNGSHIRSILGKQSVDGRKIYTVRIENTLKTPGAYTDTVIVETDSPQRPEIHIGVRGEIAGEVCNCK